ncbi:MAG: membrane dipeptidase [Anaerolineaceae bacterium]
MPLFLDAHQDLAWNMQLLGRDYRRSVHETRALEVGSPILDLTGNTLLGLPEYNQAGVAWVFGTLFAAPFNPNKPNEQFPGYQSPTEAHQRYMSQLDFYHAYTSEHPDTYRLITKRSELHAHTALWQPSNDQLKPVGLIPLMEGAEGIISLDELPEWWQKGVRIIGLAWHGNQYCGGSRQPGPLTQAGHDLIDSMAEIGFVLDLSHMDESGAFQCLERYPGPIIASHANVSALVKGYTGNRLLSNDLIRAMFQRDAVIGVIPSNPFLNQNWREDGGKSAISLKLLANQIDYLCQMAGDARHVGIGTDFDGGFGVEDEPAEIDSIADLPKILPLLSDFGYQNLDLEAIASGNFLRVLELALPE